MIDPSITEVITVLTSVIVSTLVVIFRPKNLEQLKNNGGTSLIDKVDTIVNKLTNIETSVERLEIWKTAWMELSDQPIFIANKLGRCVWVNTEYQKEVGATFSDLEGMGWYRTVASEDREKIKVAWDLAVETATTFEIPYNMINLQTNVTRLVTCKAKPLIRDSQLAGFIGIIEI